MTDWRAGAFAALSSFLAPLASAAQTVGYTVGVAGATGTYPAERVRSAFVFQTLDAAGGPVRASITVPWFRFESTPVASLPTTLSGMGDPLVRADVRIVQRPSAGWQASVAGAVKPPIVDAATGRGTGELDVAAGGNVFKAAGRTSYMADVLYWHYGDPVGVELPDTLAYSVGVARSLGAGRWSALTSVAGATAGLGDLSPPVSVTLAVLTLVGRRQSLVLSATAGLTDGASDFSAGVSWRIAH